MDPQRDLIRVVVVDDHAAIRMGLKNLLASQPGLECVGVAGDGGELEPVLYRTRPDVVVLDYHLPRVNGLQLCRQIKAEPFAPKVLLYSAYADLGLLVPAIVAGADGVIHKGTPPRKLLEAMRALAAGETRLPPLLPEARQEARAALDPADRLLLDLLIERIPRHEIASRLGLSAAELHERTGRIFAQLSVPLPRATAGPGSLSLVPTLLERDRRPRDAAASAPSGDASSTARDAPVTV